MFQGIKEKINNKIRRINYCSAVSVAASLCNRETFGDLKDINLGKEVALCGAGPSFANYKPIEGALHVALNRALLNKKIKFDYFVADDWDGIRFLQEEIINYDCVKFLGHQIGADYFREIPESFARDCGAKRYYTDSYYLGGFDSKLVCDIDKMAIGNMPNIALSAMQIVLFTRPKKIYLVGCDASSAGHFINPEGISEEVEKRIVEDAKLALSSNTTIGVWRELKEFAAAFYPDTEIVSINPVGLKGLFEDVYQ